MEQIREQEMVPYVGDYCPYLNEDESSEEFRIETVNVGFRPECVINI